MRCLVLSRRPAAWQTLRLKNCRGITDLGISSLAARCKSLRELSLHWCMGISDEALHVLMLNCARITSLDLAYTPVSLLPKCPPLWLYGTLLATHLQAFYLSPGLF